MDTDGAVEGSLGPLNEFSVLSTLVVSLPILFGPLCIDDINVDRHLALSAYLPATLEHLTITDDLYAYTTFQGLFEDVSAMAFFRAYLSGEKFGSTNLRQFVWGQDADNWNKF
jgi:hypothetical protein